MKKSVLVIFFIQKQKVLLHTMRVQRSCLPTDMPFEFLKSEICRYVHTLAFVNTQLSAYLESKS